MPDRSSCATTSKRRPRALACALLLGAGVLASPAPGAGDNAAPSLPPGLPAADKARIDKVLAKATVSTRVEIDPYALRLDVVDYLLDHPEFATQVTRALRLARYRIWRTADGLNLDDGWGVTGIMTPLYGNNGLRVIYARGRYEQSVLPDIHGQAVILLRYAGGPAPNGRPALTTSSPLCRASSPNSATVRVLPPSSTISIGKPLGEPTPFRTTTRPPGRAAPAQRFRIAAASRSGQSFSTPRSR